MVKLKYLASLNNASTNTDFGNLRKSLLSSHDAQLSLSQTLTKHVGLVTGDPCFFEFFRPCNKLQIGLGS